MHIVGCFIINADLKVVDVRKIIDLYSYYGLPRMSKSNPKISCLYIYIYIGGPKLLYISRIYS